MHIQTLEILKNQLSMMGVLVAILVLQEGLVHLVVL